MIAWHSKPWKKVTGLDTCMEIPSLKMFITLFVYSSSQQQMDITVDVLTIFMPLLPILVTYGMNPFQY